MMVQAFLNVYLNVSEAHLNLARNAEKNNPGVRIDIYDKSKVNDI